jgi:hypothetical protein
MSVRLSDLSLPLKEALQTAVPRVASTLTAEGLSSCLWSLSCLGYRWMCDSDCSVSGAPDMDSATADTESTGEELGEDTRVRLLTRLRELLPTLPPSTLSSTLSGLGRLGCTYEVLRDIGVDRAVVAGVSVLTTVQLTGTLVGLARTCADLSAETTVGTTLIHVHTLLALVLALLYIYSLCTVRAVGSCVKCELVSRWFIYVYVCLCL